MYFQTLIEDQCSSLKHKIFNLESDLRDSNSNLKQLEISFFEEKQIYLQDSQENIYLQMLLKRANRKRFKLERRLESGQIALVGLASYRKNLKNERNSSDRLKREVKRLISQLALLTDFVFENLDGERVGEILEKVLGLEREEAGEKCRGSGVTLAEGSK